MAPRGLYTSNEYLKENNKIPLRDDGQIQIHQHLPRASRLLPTPPNYTIAVVVAHTSLTSPLPERNGKNPKTLTISTTFTRITATHTGKSTSGYACDSTPLQAGDNMTVVQNDNRGVEILMVDEGKPTGKVTSLVIYMKSQEVVKLNMSRKFLRYDWDHGRRDKANTPDHWPR